ncbi:MAG: hypothetical protein KC493_13580 [Bacteriovoracaceae bacterium]|nr:hypothetical protein [Bacteriovoracaceae bacterium]
MKKENIFKPHLIIFSIFCLLLASCGYFSDEPVSDGEIYENGQMTTSCNLDTDELELILEQDVSYQIKCLEAHFRDFIKFVRVENRDYVTEHELGTFIKRFFHDQSAHIIKSLKFLFELNMLLLNDNQDQISSGNIGPLFKLMIQANRSAIIISKTLRDINADNYWDSRVILEKSFNSLANEILEIVTQRDTRDLKINIRDFLTDLKERFQDMTISEQMIDNGLFLKKLFLGGDKETLNTAEVRQLLVKAPKLIMLGIDFFYVEEKSFEDTEDLYGYYGHLIDKLEQIFHPLDDNTFLFNSKHILDLVDEMTVDEIDKVRYEKLLNSFKTDILGGKKTQFTYANLLGSSNMIKGILHSYRFYRYYHKMVEGLSDMDLGDRLKLNENLGKKLTRTLRSLEPVMINNTNIPEEMQALKFFLTAKEVFDDTIKVDEEFIRAMFSSKVLTLGGSKEKLTRDEFSLLHSKIQNLGIVGFNLLHVPFEQFEQKEALFKFYRENLGRLINIFEDLPKHKRVFTTDELLTIADWSMKKKDPVATDEVIVEEKEEGQEAEKEPIDVRKFKLTIENVKARILGGSKTHWTKSEFDLALSYAKAILDKAYFFEVTYRGQGEAMNDPEVITSLPFLDMREYDSFTSKEIRFHHDNFVYQSKYFRYFRDEEGFSYYNEDIRRNAGGFTENAIVRFALDLFLRAYGKKVGGVWGLELDDLKVILKDFKPVLEEIDLWTLNFENYVQNVLLLSDLFQSVSNGTLRLELDEGTEFANLVFQTLIMSDQFVAELKKIHDTGEDKRDGNDCSYDNPKELKFSVLKCHRPYFFDVFFNRLGYRKNYPKYAQFVDKASKQELQSFVANVEGFARDFGDDTSYPMQSRDYGLLIGAMINIEATFIRFDKNNDNLLDNTELDAAFEVYRPAIIKVAKLSESKEKYAKSIFIYMVKNMKIPSTLQLLNFHYAPWANHDVLAKRVNIGALLYYLVNQ